MMHAVEGGCALELRGYCRAKLPARVRISSRLGSLNCFTTTYSATVVRQNLTPLTRLPLTYVA